MPSTELQRKLEEVENGEALEICTIDVKFIFFTFFPPLGILLDLISIAYNQ